MRTTLPLLLAALACTDTPPASLPLEQAPPPLVLDGGPFVPGVTQRVRLTGANPGDLVGILGSTNPNNFTPTCFTSPAVCVDLSGRTVGMIVVLGTATADANGEAFIEIAVPAVPKNLPHNIQGVGDPFGAPYTSNVVTATFVDGADDEDGDGLDNASEAALGTSLSTADTDGGGTNDGDEVARGGDPFDPTDDDDSDGDGSADSEDCAPNDPDVFPEQVESCNGIDDNCDNIIDGSDVWWDTDYAYRTYVTVAGPAAWATLSPPVAVDVDLGAQIAAAGDASGLDPASIRVARQDCFSGVPEMPAEFVDGVRDLFAKADIEDPEGDGAGTVVFLADRDGDYDQRDLVNAGSSQIFAIYYNSNDTSTGEALSYSSSLVASSDGVTAELSNAVTDATFDVADGGMAQIGSVGRPTTGDQTNNNLGQGMFLGDSGGGSWVTAQNATDATLSVVHEGPILGIVRAEGSAGNAFGGFDYSYTYMLFEGRPEIYAKAVMEMNQPSSIRQSPFWGAGVRIWFTNNNAVAQAADSEGSAGIPDYQWVRGTYDVNGSAYGIGVVYRQSVALRSRPVFDPTSSANAGRFVGLAGQDITGTFDSTLQQYDAGTGERAIDNAIIAIYPHEGLFGSVSSDFFGIADGAVATLGGSESLP